MNGTLINGFNPEADPLELSAATIFVPSRRAARELTASFLKRLKSTGAVILPNIRTLGDVSDEEFGLDLEASEFGNLPETIAPISRKLELANLVQVWVDTMEAGTRELYGDEDILIPSSRSDALRLSDDLCALMSQIAQEEVSWSDIQNIVPDSHANWWELTTEFLKIIAEYWPQFLKEKGLLDPAERSALLLDLRAKRFEEQASKGPVIIAGSTGSVPSTQRLLRAVSKMPNGAVILPGLDKMIGNDEWQKLSTTLPSDDPAIETHPQFGLARLLKVLSVDRDAVSELSFEKTEPRKEQCRALISMALAPSDFTSNWIKQAEVFDESAMQSALTHVSLIEAGNERSEALTIAIAMREVLEEPDKTAALVTPDRNLAQRVSTELRRFNIDVDDTGGTPLANSRAAIFLRVLATVAFGDAGNSDLASLLKNPFCLAGTSSTDALLFGENIELIGLRGVINPVKIGTLQADLIRRRHELSDAKFVSSAVKNINDEAWDRLLEQAGKLDEIIAPLLELRGRGATFPIAHAILYFQNILLKLSTNEDGTSQLYDDEGGVELQQLFESLIKIENSSFEIEWQDIPSVLDALLLGINTRPRGNRHPRLHIYGPLEVRLLDYDRVILGSLNEGTWPQAVRSDAFLNRSIMHQLGMASPERRTGLAAHDFQQLMGKGEVILSRSERVDKSPTVASRWLQRLMAVIGEAQTKQLVQRGDQYRAYADALDANSEPAKRIERPSPTPPVEARPKLLPVTDIETWIRDPYAIYAKRILKLQPMAPLEREPDPMLKGTLYHKIMQDYIESDPLKLTLDDRLELLCNLAEENISDENLPPDVARTWILRFKEIAQPYIEWEEAYHSQNDIRKSFSEFEGEAKFCEKAFTLTARADRIDISAQDGIQLMDYKTGTNPSIKQARTLSPQLALEGLIAKRAGFKEIETGLVEDLVYIRLRRGIEFKAERIADTKHPVDSIIANAEEELRKLITGFQKEYQGYISRRVPFKEGDISGDYDHLARTREWSFGEEGESDG